MDPKELLIWKDPQILQQYRESLRNELQNQGNFSLARFIDSGHIVWVSGTEEAVRPQRSEDLEAVHEEYPGLPVRDVEVKGTKVREIVTKETLEKVYDTFRRFNVSDDRATDIITSMQSSGIKFEEGQTMTESDITETVSQVETLETSWFLRKAFEVEGIQVSNENMQAAAKWCGGKIEVAASGSEYIKVDVRKPLYPRQTMAFPGDWLLKCGEFFRVYNPVAFGRSFVENVK